MSKLPAITVTCRETHTFATRAHGRQSIDCPQCRADGHRVKVWIPADRPKTAAELARQESAGTLASAAGPGAELAARWAQQAPWDGKAQPWPGRESDTCPECDGRLLWEPGRTLTYCGPCERVALPAAVLAHYDRRAEVATVRQAESPAAMRAARVRLRALIDRMANQVSDWIDDFDPDGLSGNTLRLALDYQAELRAYLPEIRQARSEAELAEIAAEITAERAQLAQERAELAAQRKAIERQAAQRKAITSGTGHSGNTAAHPLPRASMQLVAMIEQNRREKERKLKEQGQCGFSHWGQAVATRIYGVPFRDAFGRMTGRAIGGTPQYRACPKHHSAAEATLKGDGYQDIAYWDLPIRQQQQQESWAQW
jgi:hypothetical protein